MISFNVCPCVLRFWLKQSQLQFIHYCISPQRCRPGYFVAIAAESLHALAAVTTGLFFEAMYLGRDLVLLMEHAEVNSIVGKFSRGEISATWADLNIRRFVWNARNRWHHRDSGGACSLCPESVRQLRSDVTGDPPASSTGIGPSPSTARWAPTQVIIADGVWRRADGSDTPLITTSQRDRKSVV